jgi:hypothetical protein
MWKKYLQRFILVVIAILGVKTGIESLKSSMNERSNDTAVVANWDKRLSKLTAHIPFERGLVGYISNEDIPGAAFSPNDVSGEYVLTQYAVAPLILIRGTDQQWNILNLDSKTFAKWKQTHTNDFEVVDFSGGMYLIHKVDK